MPMRCKNNYNDDNNYDLSIGEYLTDKYALWLDFRMIDENTLHGMGRGIGSAGGGITLEIEKKAESAYGVPLRTKFVIQF